MLRLEKKLIPHCPKGLDAHSFPEVDVLVTHKMSEIILEFNVKDPKSLIDWPRESATAGREDHLWRQTCFEFFICYKGSGYREWNFSPSKCWQAYDFSDYRTPNPPIEADVTKSPVVLFDKEKTLITLNSSKLCSSSLINPAAMIKLKTGLVIPYATVHFNEIADFHLKSTFLKCTTLSTRYNG